MSSHLIQSLLQALQTSFTTGVLLKAASENSGNSPHKGTLIRCVKTGEKFEQMHNQTGIVLNTDDDVTFAVFVYNGPRGEGACVTDLKSGDFVTVPTDQITGAVKKKFQLLSDTVVHRAAKSVLPTNTFSSTVPLFKYGSFVKKSGDNLIGVVISPLGTTGQVHVVWIAQTMYISTAHSRQLELAKKSNIDLLSAADYRRAVTLSGFVCAKLQRSFIVSPSTRGLDVDNYIAPMAVAVAEKRTIDSTQEASTSTKRVRRDADAKKK